MIVQAAMGQTNRSLRRFGISIVAVHFIISAVHGLAHSRLHIALNGWQSVFVLLVITVAPLISALLLWRDSANGFGLLLTSMLGSLIFGGYYHFISVSPDNVGSLGLHSWAGPFQVTAVSLAITEAAGVLTGLLGVLKKPK
ncbi:MAG: hypothetical protein QOH71_1409 [Blastocatellia bacterium]|jgi:hypothetical protein|nr:hypothetical protein [Blastocatellia bacterium]